jgi:PPOX class probable F420-dependent enzyme
MRLTADDARQRAAGADHGFLATLRAGEGPDLVPACFAMAGDVVGIPVDRVKPKASTDLRRTRNLDADPRATLLVERWDAADWARLWWVRLRLERSAEDAPTIAGLEALLRRRYPQYATAPFASILTFRIREVSGWAARPPPT